MGEPDLLSLFVRPLHDAGLRYLVAGSMGAMLYSEPRLTIDIDLAVAFDPGDLPGLSRRFPAPDFHTPPVEVIAAENARECRAHFNIIHIPSGLKADFYPSQRDEFFQWAWRNRRSVTYPHGETWFAPAEYIIVWKVAYFAEGGGEKHVRDVRRMIELSSQAIDHALLGAELERRRLLDAYRSMAAA